MATTIQHDKRRPLLAVAVLAGTLLAGGCAIKPIEPWVKPFERERFTEPQMQWSRAGLADRHREHVHAVREGARGAVGVQGGGCGCN
jgi:hypothetical protein